MTAKEVRNIISRRLHGFIGQPVILHEQDVGEPAPPLLYYRFISPLIMLMVNKEAQQNRTRTVSPAAIPSKANYRVKSKKHL